jgi:hypothetical protein
MDGAALNPGTIRELLHGYVAFDYAHWRNWVSEKGWPKELSESAVRCSAATPGDDINFLQIQKHNVLGI